MNFEFYRIFVSQTNQTALLDQGMSKNDAFRALFKLSGPLYFIAQQQQYALVLKETQNTDYIYATLGKRRQATIHKSPEENFDEEYHDDWPSVPLFINLSNSPEKGQSIAIGISGNVLVKPLKVLSVMLRKLEEQTSLQSFEYSINAISRSTDFWQIIKDNLKGIEEVTFSFVTPNLFQAADKLDDDLKSANKDLAAVRVDVKLENRQDGLSLSESQPFTKRAVEYIADGGGEYAIKVKGMEKTIKNGERVKTTKVDEIEIKSVENDPQNIKEICDKIFSCLSS